MCKASIVAKKVMDAVHGQHLEVGVSSHGLAAFHQKGEPVADCVTCVQHGERLTIWGIPLELQKKYSIDAMEVVDFVDTKDNNQDLLTFENGKEVPLIEFANQRVNVYVGELEQLQDDTIDDAGLGKSAEASTLLTA